MDEPQEAGLRIPPNSVIENLTHRIAQLTHQLAITEVALDQLRKENEQLKREKGD